MAKSTVPQSQADVLRGDGTLGVASSQAVALDGNAADFQPLGVSAAGSSGLAADGKHVHPYQPWQFLPEAYGAKGDGQVVTDGAMSSSVTPTVLACTTSTPFTSGDVGKAVLVVGAGASGHDLITTIASFTDSGHVTLAASASTTVSAKGVVWGTDDTAAINSAVSAAVTYAQANNQYAEIIFRPARYVLATAPSPGTSTQGNAIIPLPLIDATAKPKVTLAFKGPDGAADAQPHWLQPTVQVAGTCLVVLSAAGTNNATYGPAFVIGGPWNGYGETALFTNLCVIIDGIAVCPPWNSTYGGFGFWGVAEARVINAAFMPLAIEPAAGAFPQFNGSGISNGWSIGLLMPAGLNNDLCDVQYFAGWGAAYGFMPSEHTLFHSVRCLFCFAAISPVYGGSAIQAHATYGLYASVEATTRPVDPYVSGINAKLAGFPKMQLDCLDVESDGQVVDLLYDPSNVMGGRIGFQGPAFLSGYLSSNIVSGGQGVRMIALGQGQGPVSSPQAAPASGSPWVNAYYRDAWITLSATTITAVAISGNGATVNQNGLAGSPASYSFLLNAGLTYTPTYTGTLSHTVTLI